MDTGDFEIYINGDDTPDISVTGQDLGTGDIGLFRLALHSSISGNLMNFRIDHIICLYDEYVVLPPLELYYTGPNTDDSVQWTPLSAGSNFSEVDEETIDSNTSYNFSNTAGHKDIFGIPDLPFVPDYVWGVSLVTVARKEESATQEFQNVLTIDGNEFNSDSHFLSTSYVTYYDHWRENPLTEAPWEPSDLVGRKSGYQLISGS